jgi:hypothetical protein
MLQIVTHIKDSLFVLDIRILIKSIQIINQTLFWISFVYVIGMLNSYKIMALISIYFPVANSIIVSHLFPIRLIGIFAICAGVNLVSKMMLPCSYRDHAMNS